MICNSGLCSGRFSAAIDFCVALVSTPGVYKQTLEFREPNNQYFYYPTFRVDYNATQKLRVNFSLN